MNIARDPVLLHTPLTDETIRKLRVGDRGLLSGTVYTARDAAHKRLAAALAAGEELPIPLKGQVIYYVGPSPTRPGSVIGSAGPTTSSRLDEYTPALLTRGLRGMIGKGYRNRVVRDAIARHGCVYFVTVGGAAALVAERIKRVEMIAYEDLGPEAIQKLVVEDFPLVVANDAHGGDLFEAGRAAYATAPATT